MKHDVATLWCGALESGEYKQGTGGYLRDRADFWCCLGVLADLFVKEGHGRWRSVPGAAGFQLESARGAHDMTSLPEAVMVWSGLQSDNGRFYSKSPFGDAVIMGKRMEVGSLAVANDHGRTFEEIAAYIRDNWRTL